MRKLGETSRFGRFLLVKIFVGLLPSTHFRSFQCPLQRITHYIQRCLLGYHNVYPDIRYQISDKLAVSPIRDIRLTCYSCDIRYIA